MTDLNKWFLSVQDALALGNSSAATRVGLQLDARNVNDWFRKAGLEQAHVPDDKPNVFNPEPMTLGDIASLYQILGNGGVRRKLKIIQSIESRTGQVLYDDAKPDRNDGKDDLLNSLNDQQLTLTLQNALRSGPARTLTRDYGFKSAARRHARLFGRLSRRLVRRLHPEDCSPASGSATMIRGPSAARMSR